MRGFAWIGFVVVVMVTLYGMAMESPSQAASPTALTPLPNPLGGSYLQTERVSLSTLGGQGNGDSRRGRISADGQWVAFSSVANNLTEDPQGAGDDIFVHERMTGETRLVSMGLDGAGNGTSLYPRLSADGGVVVWESGAGNLVLSDTNGTRDIFWRDLAIGQTVRLSLNNEGIEGNNQSRAPDVSGDGTIVAFESAASNLVLSDTNGVKDIFVTSPPNPPNEAGDTLHAPSPLRRRGLGG